MASLNETARSDEVLYEPAATLRLRMEATRFRAFMRFLLEGLQVKILNGWSIAEFLTKHYGLTLDYIEDRIRCIFLNFAPADDVNANFLQDGSILSLCDAVPGLAGSTMRRDTPHLREMRSISASDLESKPLEAGTPGFIHVKLFNLMVRELGPTLLDKGLWLSGEELEKFLKEQDGEFWGGCRGVELDGQKMDKSEILRIKWSEKPGFVLLSADLIG